MTRDDKISTIVAAIQDDSTLVLLLRIAVTNNLQTIEDARLDALMAQLGLQT